MPLKRPLRLNDSNFASNLGNIRDTPGGVLKLVIYRLATGEQLRHRFGILRASIKSLLGVKAIIVT